MHVLINRENNECHRENDKTLQRPQSTAKKAFSLYGVTVLEIACNRRS